MNRYPAQTTPGALAYLTSPADRDSEGFRTTEIFFYFLLHVPLALLMVRSPLISTLHALLTFVFGFLWVLSARRPERAAYVGAYIVSAEVLWRMTGADVFWEFGKYALSAILIIAVLRSKTHKLPTLPLMYFVLLLPSIVITVGDMSLAEAREQIGFNLAGPFSLMISIWYFSNLKLSKSKFDRLLLVCIGPIVGIATATVYILATRPAIRFLGKSSYMATGLGSPNQVGSVLGLGAFVAFMFFVIGTKQRRSLQVLILALMIYFAVQGALTFSRGGLYMALVSAILLPLFLNDSRTRYKSVFAGLIVFALAYYVLIPFLENLTGGLLLHRFQDLSLTERDVIVLADLSIWRDNLLFGVGPGGAMYYREPIFLKPMSAATEFSRVLAEHGIFGFLSLVLFFIYIVKCLARPMKRPQRAIVISLITWAILYMLIYAMRLVAPAFVVGLASLGSFVEEGDIDGH